jgi:hypothetical protein
MVSTTQPAPEGLGVPSESVLEYLVLTRLERSAIQFADPRVRALPAWHSLARRAAAASYRECVALGLRDEASLLLGDIGPLPVGHD